MCFGGGGTQTTPTTQTVNNTTTLPPELAAYYNWQNNTNQQLFGTAQDIYNQHQQYQPYGGERIQPFTTPQLTAMNMAEQQAGMTTDPSGNLVSSGQAPMGYGQLGNADSLAQSAAQSYGDRGGSAFAPNSVSTGNFPDAAQSYMSPYLNNAVMGSLNNMEYLRGIQNQQTDSNAVTAGAFGGDRQEVAKGINNRNWDQMEGNTIAGMENQGYMNAGQLYGTDAARQLQAQQGNQQMGLNAYEANANQFNTDQARQLQAAQSEMALAPLSQQMGQNNANSLMNVGNAQQGLGQQQLTQNYTDFLNQQQWPMQMYGFLNSGFRQQPFQSNMGNTTSGQQNTATAYPQPSPVQTGLGMGLETALLGSMIFSSREFKEGGVVLDPHDALEAIDRLPLEAWRYKGDDTYHVGTYAEEFRDATGLGDGKTIPVVDVIGVLTGGLQALSRKLKEMESRA